MLKTCFSKMDFSECHLNFTADFEVLLKGEACDVKTLSPVAV